MFSGIYDKKERDGRGIGMGGHGEGVHGHQRAEGVHAHQHEEGQEGAQDEEVYIRAPPVQGQGQSCSVWSSQLNAS